MQTCFIRWKEQKIIITAAEVSVSVSPEICTVENVIIKYKMGTKEKLMAAGSTEILLSTCRDIEPQNITI
jgi:hypothetical protein